MAGDGRRFGGRGRRGAGVLRLIQAGLGSWGASWTGVVADDPNVEMVAVADPDPAAREATQGTPAFPTIEEALAGVMTDAVLVTSPPATHHAVAKAALEAGRHVLVEKPLATGLDDALDLVRIAGEVDRVLMVSQNYRFNAPFRAVQQTVLGGELGDLVSVGIGFRRDTRKMLPPGDFRYAMRHPLVLDMSIHHFDLLRAATGKDVRRVHARSWRAPDSPFVHHPEVAALLDLDGGVHVVYRGTWAAREPDTSWNGEWEFVGEEGRLLWKGGGDDRGAGEVLLERWGAPPQPVGQPGLEATERAATLRALQSSLETGEAPETAGADNVKSLAVTLGCVCSIESEQTVDVAASLDGAL